MSALNSFLLSIRRSDFAYIWCFILIIGLILSKFLLSVAMWALILIALFRLRDTGNRFLMPQYIGNIQQAFTQNTVFLFITIWFITVFISGAWSEDLSFWLGRVRLRVPFLVLPIAFAVLPPFSKKQILGLLYGFVCMMTIICIGVLIHYLAHFELIQQRLKMGQHIPVPLDHIRFSVALSFATMCGIELWYRNFFIRKTFERQLMGSMSLFLAVMLHLLAVRSGLICLYIALIIRILQYIIQQKQYIIGFAILMSVGITPLIAYQVMPSLRAKISYALWDWKMREQGTGKAYSDSERMISLVIGWKILKKNPMFGIGAGDVRQATEPLYQQHYPQFTPKMPHNQWLHIAAGTGWVGFLLCMLGFGYPLWYRRQYREPLFLTFHSIVFVSFLPESPLEIAIGTAFYVFFVCLFLNESSI